jgi:hypothetical protein
MSFFVCCTFRNEEADFPPAAENIPLLTLQGRLRVFVAKILLHMHMYFHYFQFRTILQTRTPWQAKGLLENLYLGPVFAVCCQG